MFNHLLPCWIIQIYCLLLASIRVIKVAIILQSEDFKLTKSDLRLFFSTCKTTDSVCQVYTGQFLLPCHTQKWSRQIHIFLNSLDSLILSPDSVSPNEEIRQLELSTL